MLKKKIKYTDYFGNEREEEFYFNLSKAELMQMNFKAQGGLEHVINKITQEKNVKELADLFKEIIMLSYGEPSPDGRFFLKENGELAKKFEQTEAFSELYWELATDAQAAADFVNGVIPSNLRKDIDKAVK